MPTSRIARRSTHLLLALAAVMLIAGTAVAHDFGGGTGPDGPPDDPPCPDCCPGGGGGGGGGCGGPGCGNAGDPVNTWDGAFRHAVNDIGINGYINLAFTRQYDSAVDYDSPMGYGWAHAYDLRLYRYPDSSVVLRRTCGARRIFQPDGGGYISPAGEFRNALVDDGDGTLTLAEASGTEYAFDLRGRLTSVTDVHGNSLEFEYDPAGRLPLLGVSRFSTNPTALSTISLDYRLTRVRERGALGALTGRELNLSYDAGTGRLQTITDHASRTWTYAHDANGNLTSVAAPEGVLHTYEYQDLNDLHNVTSVSEGNVNSFTMVYDTSDRVTQQTFATGTVLDMAYDTPLLQTTVVQTTKDPGDAVLRTGTTVYEFNEFGNPTKLTDAAGNEYTYVRDGEGNVTTREIRENVSGVGLVLVKTVVSTRDANGNVTQEVHTQIDTGEVVTKTWTYDNNLIATERISSSLDPSQVHGFDRVFDHNAGGFPTVMLQESRIVADGATATPTFFTLNYLYNDFGQPTLITYPNADTETFGYTNGYLTNENGVIITVDTRGNQLTRQDLNGNTYSFTPDALDRVGVIEDPDGAQTVFTYDGLNLVQMEVGKTATAAGSIHIFTNDAAGRQTRVERQTTAGLVNKRETVFDSEGNPIQITDGAGRSVSFTYDVLDRVIAADSGDGGILQYEYDAFGNITKITDGEGRVSTMTQWVIEQPGKPLSLTLGVGTASPETYTPVLDALGNLKTLLDPEGATHTEVHDAMGRLVSFRPPSGPATSYAYNGRNLIGSRTDALGRVMTYTYDGLGNLTSIDYNGTETVTVTRDPGGRITRVVDADSDMTYTYDALNRITGETNNLTSRSVTFSYNALSQRTQVVTSDGLTVDYEYDDLDRLVVVRRDGTIEVTYTRDTEGQVLQASYANGTATTYTRDPQGRIDLEETRDSASLLLSSTDYTRDNSGLVTQKHQVIRRPDTTTSELYYHYVYDALRRLTREELRASDNTTVVQGRDFTYDGVGNRLTLSVDGGDTTTYSYGLNYELLSEATAGNTINYTYDANGNLKTETFGPSTVTYDWDSENRLISLNSPTDAATYQMTWDGRRLAKTVNGSTTQYLYSGMNVITEYPSASPAITYLTGIGLDTVILRRASGQNSYYVRDDNVNSTLQLTDAAGAIQNSYVYQSFGEMFETVENTSNPYTFTSRRTDGETPHMYFRERLYSSRDGRFLSLDPFRPDGNRTARIGGEEGVAWSRGGVQPSPLFDQRLTANLAGMDLTGYIYVGNSPVNGTDPTGEIILWNPISFSVSSLCAGSACIASGCKGSACGGSGCGGSLCLGSACTGSACIGSVCGGSACGGSKCFGSACYSSGCVGSGCKNSGCVGSLCKNSVCAGSACKGSFCLGTGCSGSYCLNSGCGSSGGCNNSGCTSVCDAGSGCNSPCCK